jgi:hypothetical protein
MVLLTIFVIIYVNANIFKVMSSSKKVYIHDVQKHLVNYSKGRETVSTQEMLEEINTNFHYAVCNNVTYRAIQHMEIEGLLSFIRMKQNTRIYLVNF